MMYIIHKMLVVLKNNLNYLKNSALECFFKKNIIDFYIKRYFRIYDNGKFQPWRKNTIKDITNLCRLKKELNYTTIKDQKYF